MTTKPVEIGKRAKSSFSIWWIILGVVLMIALWMSAPYIAHKVGVPLTPGPNPSTLGEVGDSYGVATSLFGGAGFIGIALVLWFDMRQRSEARAPVLTPKVPSRLLSRTHIVQAPGSTVFSVPLDMVNVTSEPALDVRVESWLHIHDAKEHLIEAPADGPHIVPGGNSMSPDSFQLRFHLDNLSNDQEKRKIDDALDSRTGLRLTVAATYRSITGVTWATVCTFRVQRQDDSTWHAETPGTESQAEPTVIDIESGRYDALIGSSEPVADTEGLESGMAAPVDSLKTWLVTPDAGTWDFGQLKSRRSWV